jgi:O-antigen/teichoic acid export membrane protein
MSGRGLAFVLALVLARILGLEGFGIYSYATAWVAVLLVVSGLGYQGVLLRQTAIFVSQGRPEQIIGLMRRARQTVLALSVVLVFGATIVALFVVDEIFLAPLLVILPSVVIRAASLVWEGVLQGLGHTDESFISTFLIYPVVMLVAAGALVLSPIEITPTVIAGLYVLAFGLGGLALWRVAGWRLKPVLDGAEEPDELDLDVGRQLLPFTALTFVAAIGASVGTILLGAFDRPDAVGSLQVAAKLTEPILIVFIVVNVSLAPKIAGMYSRGEVSDLRPIITRNVQMSFLVAVPIAAAIFFARETLLGLFGSEFAQASTALAILVPAILFNVFTGAAGAALVMSRHVKVALVITGIGLVVNIALCLILIPSYGANGAAVAVAVDIFISNAMMAGMAWRILGLNTTALAIPQSFRTSTGS